MEKQQFIYLVTESCMLNGIKILGMFKNEHNAQEYAKNYNKYSYVSRIYSDFFIAELSHPTESEGVNKKESEERCCYLKNK